MTVPSIHPLIWVQENTHFRREAHSALFQPFPPTVDLHREDKEYYPPGVGT